ncbi:MAG: hypothetical protein P1U68_12855 [Verrucomicrobiales bacterium]|nr:hypothetical protein [Verrucomicrobiales bacterium]
MMNRRQSRASRHSLSALARAWETRYVIVLAFAYLISFGWLFSAGTDVDIRPSEILVTPGEPLWKTPGDGHLFGTTATGLDLFHLCRIAMARAVAVAAIATALGLALAFLTVMLFAFDPGERRFSLLKSWGRVGVLMPCALVLLIVQAGAGGGITSFVVATSLLISIHSAPAMAEWFEKGEKGHDILSAYVVGLSRSEIVTNRIVPTVIRKLIGIFATLIPQVALVEMGVSFLGMGSERLSIGGLISYGQQVIIEAPWLAIYPGIFASVVTMFLTLLGWLTSRALKSEPIRRFI